MGAQLRSYRQKISATRSMGKLFNAMELIATSRIPKARKKILNTEPYLNAIVSSISSVIPALLMRNIKHPLISEVKNKKRIAMIVVTSDRGMAGAYSSNILKEVESMHNRFNDENVEIDYYIYGRKGEIYYQYRNVAFIKSWIGNSDSPNRMMSKKLTLLLMSSLKKSYNDGGIDSIYIAYTKFLNMVEQKIEIFNILPVISKNNLYNSSHAIADYEFEPSPKKVLDIIMPKYIEAKIFNCILQAAASELAFRQKAMKTAVDNAKDLMNKYTLLANVARQAEITQELSEIVAGADALSSN